MSPAADLEALGHRRPHRKSKNGCQQCKQKKVKCDECKPSCGHCRRFHSTCSFLGTLSPAPSTTDAIATSSLPQQIFGNREGSPGDGLNSTDGLPVSNLTLFEVKDLELLHFYTTKTSFTISNIPERQHVWQQVIPQTAFNHQFLLHGVLAFAALHLARVQPEHKSSLYAKASNHNDMGLKTFRTAMQNITPQNCDACFAFSSLLVAYAWASSDQTGDLFFPEQSISSQKCNVEWVTLLRGVDTLVRVAGDWLSSGPMGVILPPWSMDPELAKAADPEASAKLTALSRLWDSQPITLSVEDVEVLNETLDLLKEGYGLVASSSVNPLVDKASVAFSWPLRVPAAFHTLVYELKPEALVILAYYSLLLNKVDQVWFMHGMSRRLLQSIHSRIGQQWESWIAWPLQALVLNEFRHQGEMSQSYHAPSISASSTSS